MPYSLLKVTRSFGGTSRFRRLAFNRLHGVISQTTELFIAVALRTSHPIQTNNLTQTQQISGQDSYRQKNLT
jgi:hypothetical protein